jgi:SAM-dependent methyltransferase
VNRRLRQLLRPIGRPVLGMLRANAPALAGRLAGSAGAVGEGAPRQPLAADDTAAVAEFVAESDRRIAASGSAQPYWDTVEFVVSPSVSAAALREDPLGEGYFRLQETLYVGMCGHSYAEAASEDTAFDLEAVMRSPLAYPDRQPRDLLRSLRAMVTLADQFAGDGPLRVLELGSGWGFSTEFMARLGHRVTGVDINPRFVDAGRRRSERDRLGIEYRLGTFDALPLGEGERFDVVFSTAAFHHARRPLPVLLDLVPHLAPRGQLILSGEPFIDTWMWPHWGLRTDPLSVYCIAKFGWWEAGWTRAFMEGLFRLAGLTGRFVDHHSDLERYLIGTREEVATAAGSASASPVV